jgi:hypothetical protein
MKNLLFPFLACLSLAPIDSSHAALVAYEPFNYASLTNGTATTGTGFSGAWTSAGPASTIQPNLTFPDLPTQAAAVRPGAGQKATELFSGAISGGTIYASFLIKGNGDSGGVSVGGVFTGSTGNLFVGFGAGFTATETGFGLGTLPNGGGYAGVSGYQNAMNLSNTATHYIVLSLDSATNSVSLWINPAVTSVAMGDPGVPTLSTGAFTLGNITGLGYQGDGVTPTVDEFRVGTTFADVAGVPEPNICVWIGVGLATGLGFGRRRA